MFHVKTFRNDNYFLSSSSSCSPRLSSEIELSSESIRSLWPSKLLLTYFSTLCLLFLLCCLVYTRLKELKAEVPRAKVDQLSRTSQLFFLLIRGRAREWRGKNSISVPPNKRPPRLLIRLLNLLTRFSIARGGRLQGKSVVVSMWRCSHLSQPSNHMKEWSGATADKCLSIFNIP